MNGEEAINALRTFVASEFDGSLAACFRLDELLWEVRRSHPHNWTTVAADPPDDLSDIEINLEELGL